MMGVIGFSHIAVGVSDIERSVDFYHRVLGLEIWIDHVEDIEVDAVAAYRRHAVYLALPGSRTQYVVLDCPEGAAPAAPKARDLLDRGVHHFSFSVDNLDEIFERAVARGCPVLVRPYDLARDDPLNPIDSVVRTTLFRDPDGNIVQLDQYR